ncbi:hypothetical protein HDV06_004859 [Boothiomyces sp. JEL0866]|nr:hypothetical protein HDV06_004859 [Boothiomyces sp. JEL0866]
MNIFIPADPVLDWEKALSHLVVFSAIGVVVRYYALTLTGYILPAILFPQVIGCFILGFVNSHKWILKHHYLKLGLGTGLCGSITTFSSFIVNDYRVFQSDILNGFILIGLMVSCSVAAYKFGKHIGNMELFHYPHVIVLIDSSPIWLIFAILTLIGVAIWCAFQSNLSFGLAVLFGPFGTILRYFLSKFNQPTGFIPFGTFIANISATILLCFLNISETNGFGGKWCAIAYGLEVGFCGCLSTISTFIAELCKLETPFSYRYGIISIATGLLSALLILGSWSASGHGSSACS